jgi:hypothetical protein
MKIRQGFVTNSSSSSYIIAIRHDATVKDVEDMLKKNLKCVKEAISYNDTGDGNNDVNQIIKMIAKRLFDTATMDLEGEWVVGGEEVSSEDGDLECGILYSLYDIKGTDKVKFSHVPN